MPPLQLPPFPGGMPAHPIGEGMIVVACVAAVLGFFLVGLLASVMLRLLAILGLIALAVGTPILLCVAVAKGLVKTWEELGLLTAYAGVAATFSAVVLKVFLIDDRPGNS